MSDQVGPPFHLSFVRNEEEADTVKCVSVLEKRKRSAKGGLDKTEKSQTMFMFPLGISKHLQNTLH